MSNYNINWQSNGQTPAVPGKSTIILPEKTADTSSTSLTLTGKGLNNYGEIQQDNFIRLLEHFAAATPPANATIGQLWYNTTESALYIKVDPASPFVTQPKYYPQNGVAAWVQIYPAVQTSAGLAEFNGLAAQINKIIGAPTPFSSAISQQYGWGQSDLVPEYTDANTLAPGFTTQGFPSTFDNSAWTILLSRLRKALRQIGQPETGASPVGFINDGRPSPGGTTIGNNYNSYPSPGTLANYTAGWNGLGSATLNLYYANTLNAISTLDASRFVLAPASSQLATIVSGTRSANWGAAAGKAQIVQTASVTFASQAAAMAFFNAGGSFKFSWAHALTSADPTNVGWTNFLNQETDLIFDYLGVRHGSVYENTLLPGKITSPGPTSTSVGFYDLTSSSQYIYVRDRMNSSYAYTITDGGIEVAAYTSTGSGTSFIINFVITMIENGSTPLIGNTTSVITATWPSALNTNSPAMTAPVGVATGDFV